MTNNNLWEIIKFEDLVYLLRNKEKKFVVLSIITDETDEQIKNMIKKIIKAKSKIYPKVTFLFYKAKKQDFGRLEPMFGKDLEEYPKLYHIWNIKHILLGILGIDNKEILEKSFEKLNEVYLSGTYEESDSESEPDSDDNNKESNIKEKNNSNVSDDGSQKKKKIQQQKKKKEMEDREKQKQIFEQQQLIQQQQYKNQELESNGILNA